MTLACDVYINESNILAPYDTFVFEFNHSDWTYLHTIAVEQYYESLQKRGHYTYTYKINRNPVEGTYISRTGNLSGNISRIYITNIRNINLTTLNIYG